MVGDPVDLLCERRSVGFLAAEEKNEPGFLTVQMNERRLVVIPRDLCALPSCIARARRTISIALDRA